MNTMVIMRDMGIFDATLPHFIEASFLRDIAQSECDSVSELFNHPLQQESAFNWVIHVKDANAIAQAVSDVCEAEMRDLAEKDPLALMAAMLSNIFES